MSYFLKQNFLTWGERFAIYDASARNRYFVDSDMFAFGKVLYLRSLGGNDLAEIRQKVWNLNPTYLISLPEKEPIKMVYNKKQGFQCKSLGLTANGDFAQGEYVIKDKDGKILASVSKKWFTLGDAYGIEVASGTDTALMLSIVLAVEAWKDKRDKMRD
jgi:uncharacterized protein YxjI